MLENTAAKKATKNLSLKCRQKCQNCVKKGLVFRSGNVPKIIKNQKKSKLVPETSRCPKSIQKGSKRHPKDIQKASNFFHFGFQWNQNHKDIMQRTAKNHAPYQSLPTKRNHKIGTVAGCAAQREYIGAQV